MSNPKILIVDDEPAVRKLVRRTLEAENFATSELDNGHQVVDELGRDRYDLVIIDINMDGMDGFEVIQNIRKKGLTLPIFILSGRSEDYDIVLGYGISADAYITKPFSPVVLASMVKAQIKKLDAARRSQDVLIAPPFSFDKNLFLVYKNDVELALSSKEIKLMRFFMENCNKVFTKEQIYENVWNNMAVSDNNIMVFISKLRQKIEDDPENPVYLRTIWGIGYVFSVDR